MVETFIVKQVFPLTEFDGREGKVKALPMILAGASGEIYLEAYNDRADSIVPRSILRSLSSSIMQLKGSKRYETAGFFKREGRGSDAG